MNDILIRVETNSLSDNFRLAVDTIIRPKRAKYDPASIPDVMVRPSGKIIPRVPISFCNRKGKRFLGSLYLTETLFGFTSSNCVVYLHGNCGSQLEGRYLVEHVLSTQTNMFCFDFSGSGCSDGEFITLGYSETEDTNDCLAFLSLNFGFTSFILWGRSMGAAVSVMASSQNPLVKGIIVDSCFHSLAALMDHYTKYIDMPQAVRNAVCWYLKRKISSRASFECDSVNPSLFSTKAHAPMLIGHAIDDEIVPYEQGLSVFASYGGLDKELVSFEGGHNGVRSPEWTEKCMEFISRVKRTD